MLGLFLSILKSYMGDSASKGEGKTASDGAEDDWEDEESEDEDASNANEE